ncbi:MAG: anaerobic ribonucleoside-triphosphate reductase activating protein [Planctomycetes bacterium]|nr:anaerobic ribonucleoside-triphosphate reductase activating protein [Planctomycetota bacterium]
MQIVTTQIKGLIETSLIDWPGRLATVMFLPGCNLRCGYCHAKELIENGGERLDSIPLGQVTDFLSGMAGWVDGVVISGGEPTLHPDLPALAARIKSLGFAVKLDTNGTHPEVIERLITEGLIDAVAMDVKAPLDERYERITRVTCDVKDIAESIGIIMASGLEYELRTTVAPSLLTVSDIGEIAEAIRGAKVYALQPFRPHACLDEAMEHLPPCPASVLEDAARLARGFVERVVIRH